MAHLDLAQRAIATLAPLFCVLGTVVAILTYVFQPPIGGDTPSSTLGHVAERLSNALEPAAFGLFVGIIALTFHRYLRGSLGTFDREMDEASSALAADLARYGHLIQSTESNDRLMLGAQSAAVGLALWHSDSS